LCETKYAAFQFPILIFTKTKIFIMPQRFLVILSVIILLSSCKQQADYTQLLGFTQGTTYNIIYDSPDHYRAEIDSLLAEFDTSLSSYNQASIISRINRNEEEVQVDEFFKTVFNTSQEISKLSDGAFDITVGPIVRAYGFGFSNRETISTDLIDSLLEFVDYNLVRLEGNLVIKDHLNTRLDVNAIAQGYAVDVLAEYLESRGRQNYLVEIGGEVKTKGLNRTGELWRVGVDKPIDDTAGVAQHELQAVIALQNKSLATSGNYRKFYIENGVKYAHTIDPRIGMPVQHKLLSATVVADDCMTADAYATAFMVMGAEEALEFANKNGIDVYLIVADTDSTYTIQQTAGFKAFLAEEF